MAFLSHTRQTYQKTYQDNLTRHWQYTKLPLFPFTPESLTSVRRIVFELIPGLLVCALVFLYVSLFLENWRRQWHPTPVLLPRKSHRRRSLVGCSPWGRKESDTTGYFIFTFTLFLEPLPSCVVSLPVATPLVPKDEMWPLFPLFRMGRSCQF